MINFGIPGLIFQAKVTNFGANVGLHILINRNFGLYHYRKKHFGKIFPTLHIENHC